MGVRAAVLSALLCLASVGCGIFRPVSIHDVPSDFEIVYEPQRLPRISEADRESIASILWDSYLLVGWAGDDVTPSRKKTVKVDPEGVLLEWRGSGIAAISGKSAGRMEIPYTSIGVPEVLRKRSDPSRLGFVLRDKAGDPLFRIFNPKSPGKANLEHLADYFFTVSDASHPQEQRAPQDGIETKLAELKVLLEKRLITKEEHDRQRARVLGGQ